MSRSRMRATRPRAAAELGSADGSGLLSLVSRNGRVEVLRIQTDGGEPEVVVGGDREVASFSVSARRPAAWRAPFPIRRIRTKS